MTGARSMSMMERADALREISALLREIGMDGISKEESARLEGLFADANLSRTERALILNGKWAYTAADDSTKRN